MTRFRTAFVIILAGMLVAACTRTVSPPSQQPLGQLDSKTPSEVAYSLPKLSSPQQDNARISDFAGGPIKMNHITDRRPIHSLSSQFPGVLYYSGPRTVKQVALTFDDGPDVHYTTQILDILKRNGIKATFFIIGNRAQAHPEMVRLIAREGHAIGNHTWDHPILTKVSPEQVRSELYRTDQLLHSILGYYPAIFRPPYGAANVNVIRQVADMQYKIIDWSVDSRDWAGTPTPQIIGFVKKELYPGGIILQHCAGGKGENLSNTVRALPEIISTLRAEGYKFVTVPELLKIQASM